MLDVLIKRVAESTVAIAKYASAQCYTGMLTTAVPCELSLRHAFLTGYIVVCLQWPPQLASALQQQL